ncbi:hypothetical protein MMC27_002381 [Xylographa pallens]|nr:hypothetical protein [Xylographa pallens]
MDPLTAATILQIQLQDLQDLSTARTDESPRIESSDAVLARALYKNELQNASVLLSDHQMSWSIAQAVAADANMIHAIRGVELNARDDRRLAHQIAGRRVPEHNQIDETTSAEEEDDVLQRLGSLNVRSKSVDLFHIPDVEIPASGSEAVVLVTVTCTSCGNEVLADVSLEAPCHHSYCGTCVASLFELSMHDQSLFPPRCCREEIHLAPARRLLSSELIEIFSNKYVELSTPDRTYCHEKSCAAFIPPTRIEGNVGLCPSCPLSTCALCKGDYHYEQDCPEDPIAQELLRSAQAAGYQRCYSCKIMVELQVGCNHMV